MVTVLKKVGWFAVGRNTSDGSGEEFHVDLAQCMHAAAWGSEVVFHVGLASWGSEGVVWGRRLGTWDFAVRMRVDLTQLGTWEFAAHVQDDLLQQSHSNIFPPVPLH